MSIWSVIGDVNIMLGGVVGRDVAAELGVAEIDVVSPTWGAMIWSTVIFSLLLSTNVKVKIRWSGTTEE